MTMMMMACRSSPSSLSRAAYNYRRARLRQCSSEKPTLDNRQCEEGCAGLHSLVLFSLSQCVWRRFRDGSRAVECVINHQQRWWQPFSDDSAVDERRSFKVPEIASRRPQKLVFPKAPEFAGTSGFKLVELFRKVLPSTKRSITETK